MNLTWESFLKILKAHQKLNLRFHYNGNSEIASDYHITEFKLAQINSVDCGGNVDSWNEMLLQILEPAKENKEPMAVEKVLSIISKVSEKIQISANSILRIEFGNSNVSMSQFFVETIGVTESSLVVYLKEGATECKASASCGLPKEVSNQIESSSSGCCAPKVQTNNLEISNQKSGCC